MTKPWLNERGHALEEEYFWNKEKELIGRLREEGRQKHERQTLGERLETEDEALTAELVAAGITPQTLALLHLVPLIEVAWAEGEVTDRERQLIVAMAERRGAAPDDEVHLRLNELLAHRPDEAFYDVALKGERALLTRMSVDARANALEDLEKRCVAIAEAAGGILGMGTISPEERAALKHIHERLGETEQAVAGKRLDAHRTWAAKMLD